MSNDLKEKTPQENPSPVNPKIHLWLTTEYQGRIESLSIKTDKNGSNEKDLNGYLWFYDNEKKQAYRFLRRLRRFLKWFYPHKDRAKWMTNDWVNKI